MKNFIKKILNELINIIDARTMVTELEAKLVVANMSIAALEKMITNLQSAACIEKMISDLPQSKLHKKRRGYQPKPHTKVKPVPPKSGGVLDPCDPKAKIIGPGLTRPKYIKYIKDNKDNK